MQRTLPHDGPTLVWGEYTQLCVYVGGLFHNPSHPLGRDACRMHYHDTHSQGQYPGKSLCSTHCLMMDPHWYGVSTLACKGTTEEGVGDFVLSQVHTTSRAFHPLLLCPIIQHR